MKDQRQWWSTVSICADISHNIIDTAKVILIITFVEGQNVQTRNKVRVIIYLVITYQSIECALILWESRIVVSNEKCATMVSWRSRSLKIWFKIFLLLICFFYHVLYITQVCPIICPSSKFHSDITLYHISFDILRYGDKNVFNWIDIDTSFVRPSYQVFRESIQLV